jgi:hypothetical protein
MTTIFTINSALRPASYASLHDRESVDLVNVSLPSDSEGQPYGSAPGVEASSGRDAEAAHLVELITLPSAATRRLSLHSMTARRSAYTGSSCACCAPLTTQPRSCRRSTWRYGGSRPVTRGRRAVSSPG